jgi:carbamoyl-phosphate synthase large subunit
MFGRRLNLMFIGAGKRLSLLERFQSAAVAEGIELGLFSIERERRVPIAGIAQVLEGPSLDTDQSDSFLLDKLTELGIDMVIPNIDNATVALARLKPQIAERGAWAVVSDLKLCEDMCDKELAEKWVRSQAIPVPDRDEFPRIVKLRNGSGAKGQHIVLDEAELSFLAKTINLDNYIIQTLLQGREYTVDAYVDRTGRLLGSLSRRRLVVCDGEVEVSETERHETILGLTQQILSYPGWEGPITLQFIAGPHGNALIEINPRFGGGVTHSIHCGLDMPRWLIRERLGLPNEPFNDWQEGSFMTRCRRDIFL